MSEAAGLLQLVCQAKQPMKEKIQESLNRIQLACACSQGLQIGLSACIDVLGILDTNDPLNYVHIPTEQNVSKPAKIGKSYAAAVKSTPKKPSNKQIKQNKLIQKQIAKERNKNHCDLRSIRLKALAPSGVVNNGVLARSFCAFLNLNGREHEIVEDIGIDKKGCYYLQVKEQVFEEVISLLGKTTHKKGFKESEFLLLTEEFYNWKKVNWEDFHVKLHFHPKQHGWNDFKWKELSNANQLESNIEDLETCIKSLIEDLVPKARRSTQRKPWWNEDLSLQHKLTKRAFRKAYKDRYKPNASELRNIALEEQRTLRKMIRDAKNNAWKAFIEEEGNEDMWKTFKRVTKSKQTVDLSYIKTPQGIITDSAKIADFLSKKFFPKPTYSNMEKRQQDDKQVLKFLEENNFLQAPHATCAEIKKAVFRSKPFGAVGPDGIPNILLRKYWFSLEPIITGLMNAVLRVQHLSKCWKRSKLVVISKASNSSQDIKDFRPILLLPALNKAFEALMNDRLMYYLEREGLLEENQHGFKKYKGTNTTLISMTSLIEDNFKKGLITYECSLDIQSAFDSVSHFKIIISAIKKNVPNYLVSLLHSFTKDRTAQLTVQGTSYLVNVGAGTPQGSSISPSLFVLYMDGIIKAVKRQGVHTNRLIQAFADDLWVSTWGHNDVKAQATIQETLTYLTDVVKDAG
eukprot:g4446.t1